MIERPYKSEHIFQTIINDLENKRCNIHDKMEAISIYYSCEILLQNTKENNRNYANYQMHDLVEKYSFLDETLKKYLGILFYPACAYFEFVYGSSLLAETFIKKAIKLIGLVEINSPNYVMAKVEQTINIYRIHKREKNFEMCRKLAKSILLFIEKGESSGYTSLSPLFNQVPKKELLEFKKYFKSIKIKCPKV